MQVVDNAELQALTLKIKAKLETVMQTLGGDGL
jgi:hypothetical protein